MNLLNAQHKKQCPIKIIPTYNNEKLIGISMNIVIVFACLNN